jgi:hypothetical protein
VQRYKDLCILSTLNGADFRAYICNP